MDKQIAVSLAYINLNSTINKLLFRLQREPQKKVGIDQQIEDLDFVREVIRFLDADNKALHKRNTELELRLLKAIEENNELKKKNNFNQTLPL